MTQDAEMRDFLGWWHYSEVDQAAGGAWHWCRCQLCEYETPRVLVKAGEEFTAGRELGKVMKTHEDEKHPVVAQERKRKLPLFDLESESWGETPIQ